MAVPAPYAFPMSFPSQADPTLSLPSPPQSILSETFDFDAFTHCSPVPADELDFENTFGLSPVASTASSTNLISPKSAFNDYTFPEVEVESPTSAVSDASAAEALSNHHLQRYFHYKNLASQAEAQARAATEQLESLFAAYGMPTNPGFNNPGSNNNNNNTITDNKMLQFQTQPQPHMQYQAPPQQFMATQQWQIPAPQQQVSVALHAQAQAHMQAHEAVQGRAMPVAPMTYYTAPRADAAWSRQSSSTHSIASPPAPATPLSAQPFMAPAPVSVATAQSSTAECRSRSCTSEGESELQSEEDSKPSLPLTNLSGGGRGYVPGKTPDDPKKRHKCDICGRGFARAFNLKSHLSTHDPLRSKPYTCPHSNCRRGFSRLHDLERHRQGIHSDGPLVDAKRQGVSPSIVRAQGRIPHSVDQSGL